MSGKNLLKRFFAANKPTLKKWMIWVYLWGLSTLLWPIADIALVETKQANHGSPLLHTLTWIWFGLFLLIGFPISLRIFWLTHFGETG